MLVFALAVATATHSDGQILAGRAFENLAARSDAACNARGARMITPGDLDYIEESFESRLLQRTQTRLRSIKLAGRKCAGVNGLSCAATATLDAFDAAGLMPSFTGYICSHPNPKVAVTFGRRKAAGWPTQP
jgi:hypothetical protein